MQSAGDRAPADEARDEFHERVRRRDDTSVPLFRMHFLDASSISLSEFDIGRHFGYIERWEVCSASIILCEYLIQIGSIRARHARRRERVRDRGGDGARLAEEIRRSRRRTRKGIEQDCLKIF